jgi:hypothetical protein
MTCKRCRVYAVLDAVSLTQALVFNWHALMKLSCTEVGAAPPNAWRQVLSCANLLSMADLTHLTTGVDSRHALQWLLSAVWWACITFGQAGCVVHMHDQVLLCCARNQVLNVPRT